MKVLLRIALILGCIFMVIAVLLPVFFRDRRPGIFHAVERGDTNAITQHLARGSNVNGLILTYIYGGKRAAPLLSIAARSGQSETVQFLLENKASPNQQDWQGESPLFYAMRSDEKHTEIVKKLLAAGADPNLASSGYRYTPLIQASSLGLTEIVRLLLAAGADATATNAVGQTSLHLANHAAIVKLLVAAGAHREARDQGGRTPADTIAWLGHFDALWALTNSPQTQPPTNSIPSK